MRRICNPEIDCSIQSQSTKFKMPQPSDLTKQVMDRIMNLKEFTVTVPVEENWLPNGIVPFDIKIKNGFATVTLPALTEDEARSKLIEYLSSSDKED